MKKSTIVLTVVSVALGALAICLGVGYFVNTSKSMNTLSTVNGMYERSFYELVDSVNNMEVNLSKLRVTDGYLMQQKLLTSIVNESASAQSNLSALPLSDNALVGTTKFVNQVNGYCTSLINYDSKSLSSKNFDDLDSIYDNIATIKNELNNVIRSINKGYRIVDNIDSNDKNLSSNLKQINNDSIEYPTLIYDGPFSDSVVNREVKGLSGDRIGEEEAKQKLVELLESWNVEKVEYLRKNSGKIETHDFSIKVGGGEYYAQISVIGGHLLSLSSAGRSGGLDVSEQDCVNMAEEFVNRLGLEDMKVVWHADSNGICYLNLTSIKNGTIIYPEMVKVKINKTTGDIIGYEATTYYYNYDTDRTILSPQIDVINARTKVSSKINIKSTKMCVVPQEYGDDVFSYEFMGEYDGYTYYVYVDAMSGDVVNIMRVVQTDDGALIL